MYIDLEFYIFPCPDIKFKVSVAARISIFHGPPTPPNQEKIVYYFLIM